MSFVIDFVIALALAIGTWWLILRALKLLEDK